MSKATVTLDGEVAELVINGPPLNLFDAGMITDVESAIAEVGTHVREHRARAMLLRAEGKVFCAGVDVHEFEGLSTAEGSRLMARFLSAAQGLEALPVPTVAVVHGLNLTIGMELSLACDMIWAATDASFGLVEATVGLTPGAGGTQRLVARAGYARAAEFVMTGDVYAASVMHEWGVLNRLVPAAELLAQARAFAARLAAGPTAALSAAKTILQAARDHGVAAADAITPRAAGAVFATDDLPAGLASLLRSGPRKAVFTGR
jgi:enoyl-CoA hydratase/carnithine racemase